MKCSNQTVQYEAKKNIKKLEKKKKKSVKAICKNAYKKNTQEKSNEEAEAPWLEDMLQAH
jgi:hypothetical protein